MDYVSLVISGEKKSTRGKCGALAKLFHDLGADACHVRYPISPTCPIRPKFAEGLTVELVSVKIRQWGKKTMHTIPSIGPIVLMLLLVIKFGALCRESTQPQTHNIW